MKTQLLIFLFSIIFCSPFLRKLDEAVTEASCKKQGKKYQAAVPSQCKIANIILENKLESDCKSGTWTAGKDECSAKDITDKNECNGTPEFTPGSTKTKSTCKLGDEELTDSKYSESADACQKALEWKNECTITEEKTEEECSTLDGDFTENTSTPATRRTEGEAKTGTCTYTVDKSKADCDTVKGTYSGSCSVAQFTSSEKCTGTPVYTEGEAIGTCKKGTVTLTDRTTEATCKVELKWVSGSCSPYKELLTQEECESKASFTAATAAKCVEDTSSDDAKSGSNFIKAINFALLAICLLIL